VAAGPAPQQLLQNQRPAVAALYAYSANPAEMNSTAEIDSGTKIDGGTEMDGGREGRFVVSSAAGPSDLEAKEMGHSRAQRSVGGSSLSRRPDQDAVDTVDRANAGLTRDTGEGLDGDRHDALSMVTPGATANTTEGNSRTSREPGLLYSHSHGESIDGSDTNRRIAAWAGPEAGAAAPPPVFAYLTAPAPVFANSTAPPPVFADSSSSFELGASLIRGRSDMGCGRATWTGDGDSGADITAPPPVSVGDSFEFPFGESLGEGARETGLETPPVQL